MGPGSSVLPAPGGGHAPKLFLENEHVVPGTNGNGRRGNVGKETSLVPFSPFCGGVLRQSRDSFPGTKPPAAEWTCRV